MEDQEFRAEMRKDMGTLLRLTRESNKTMAMAATHIVATSEKMQRLTGQIDGMVDDAEQDSRDVGIVETRIATKQEQLLDIQIQNARADGTAKTRGLIKDYLTIFTLAVAVGLTILGFLKFYVKLP